MNKDLIKNISSRFKVEFKSNPVLIFSPGRINLIGEHTDYNNGFVFPAAIDKGIVAALQKSQSKTSRIIALDLNENYELSLENVSAVQNGDWKNYIIGIICELKKMGKHVENFNLIFSGDIPNGAGMSSSAALENSIVFGLNELFNLRLSKEEMILISQKAEHNYVGVKCGIMDQYASMLGQKDAAILLDCKSLEAKPIKLNLQDYSLLLINTNVKHSLAESAYNERRSICDKIASKLHLNSLRDASEKELFSIKENLTESEYQKALYVIQENQRVLKAYKAISKNDFHKLGELLFASHYGLKNQYEVSCKELDFLVKFAQIFDNAIGARMMGGGFGGCTLNLIKKEGLEIFKKEIAISYYNTFKKKCSFYEVNLSDGTKIISIETIEN